MGSKRPSIDEYFIRMARLASKRSTCLRRKVGCVIVQDNRVLSTGYNGAPKGLKHCMEVGCLREGNIPEKTRLAWWGEGDEKAAKEEVAKRKKYYPKKGEKIESGFRHEICRGVHAEQNAIIQAAVFGTSVRGGQLYCTTFPCTICAKMLINAEITEIIYDGDYEDPLSKDLLQESGVKVRRFGKKK